MEEAFPDLKTLFSGAHLQEETVFYVDDVESPFVDEQGIIHVNLNFFRYMVSAMNEFFRTYKQGMELKLAFSGLINLLSGELYGSSHERH
jgi:hypothetical protein